MFIDFKFGTTKAQVRAYLNPMQKFSLAVVVVADFHFPKPGLTKHVLLVVNQV